MLEVTVSIPIQETRGITCMDHANPFTFQRLPRYSMASIAFIKKGENMCIFTRAMLQSLISSIDSVKVVREHTILRDTIRRANSVAHHK